MAIVPEKVKPERQRKNLSGEYALRKPLPQKWWIYADKRPALYGAIVGMRQVLCKTRHSPNCAFEFMSTGIVYQESLTVFALSVSHNFAALSSTLHEAWAWKYGSTLGGNTLRYSPSDCFETFPFPVSTGGLDDVGERYHNFRQQIMLAQQEGLTKTYNRFHKVDETADDIVQLRALHVDMDHAVAAAYGWTNLGLEHGFHTTKQGVRFTVSERARREILDRLLLLNHARYRDEVAQGLHDKGAKKNGKGKRKQIVNAEQAALL